jgi:hypothetical protein
VGLRAGLHYGEEKKVLLLPGIEPQLLGCLAIPTELPELLGLLKINYINS